MHQVDHAFGERHDAGRAGEGPAAGKRTLTSAIQRQAAPTPPAPEPDDDAAPAIDVMAPFWFADGPPAGAPVQRRGAGARSEDDVHAAAARGVAGGATALPFLDAIQASFGPHDVSGVQAHVGGAAAEASAAIGAQAYATGDHVAFAGAPDLHTAAHEAAHVVQQRAGVHLKGGVGADGDAYEQHADAVADRVVAGRSAADLLEPGGGGAPAVQRYQRYRINDQQDDLWPAGKTVRVSEDGRLAVGEDDGYGSHDLWAEAALIGPANLTLQQVGSMYQLTAGATTLPGRAPSDGAARVLTKVVPIDGPTGDAGDAMTMPDDCGDAAHEVTGAIDNRGKRSEMVGVYRNLTTGVQQVTTRCSDLPMMMRREIMMPFVLAKSDEPLDGLLNYLAGNTRALIDRDRVARLDEPMRLFRAYAALAQQHRTNVIAPLLLEDEAIRALDPSGAEHQRRRAALDVDWKKAQAKADALEQEQADVEPRIVPSMIALDKLLIGAYGDLTAGERDAFERAVGINRYAVAEPGQAFAIETGGRHLRRTKPDNSPQITYNTHWAGVIMKTGGDAVTMENSAMNVTVRNQNWIFQMYGAASDVAEKRGQTFHEQNRDTLGAHGDRPTTMVAQPR